MASSGSFTTSAYGGVRSITYNWSLSSQNVTSNNSTISQNFQGSGSNSSSWYYTKNGYLNVNGSRVWTQDSSSKIQLYVGTVLYSGTSTIGHNSDGTKSFSADGGATIYYYSTYQTGSGSWSLPTIARASKINSFSGTNIESSFKVTYTSYSSSFTNKLRISIPQVVALQTKEYTSGTSFTLDDSTIEYLYEYMASSKTVQLGAVIETYSGSTKIGESSEIINTCSITNANPTFTSSQLTYKDTNEDIVAITGSNQYIVQNQSNLKATFTDATANKGASMSSYEVTFNGKTTSYTAGQTIDFGKVNSSSNLTLSIKAIDTRGYSTTISKTIKILEWSLPKANVVYNRTNNYEDETTLNVDTTISSVNSKNSIQSIKYRYKQSGSSSYGSYTTIENATDVVIEMDKLYAWDFHIQIKDKFGTTNYYFTLPKGMPILFIDILLQAVGINSFPTKSKSLNVGGYEFDELFAVGEIKITAENQNPSDSGCIGTWELLHSGTIFSGLDTTFYVWKRTE